MDTLHIVHHPRTRSIIAETVLALTLFFVDPLGVTAHKSHVIDNTIASATQFNYRSKASDKLAVVLIDQKTLSGWQIDWPLNYQKTAELVHALACARAIGVFFDFTLSKEFNLADGQELLEAVTTDSSSAGPDCADGQRPERMRVLFGKADKIASPLAQRLDRGGDSYWLDVASDDSIYPAGKIEFPDAPLPANQVSPAFGIVRSVPKLGFDISHGTAALCQYHDPRPKCWLEPLALVWSGNVNPKQGMVSRTESCRGFVDWGTMLASLIGLTNEGKFETCPPILTLKAEDLFRDRTYIAANGNPAALLAERFVFVGTRLAGLNDQIFSPVHGYLPGVYKHAVATDNLISYGANYPTIPRPWLLGVIVVITYALIEAVKELSGGSGRRRLIIGLVTLVCLATWVAIIFVLRWPPSLLLAVFGYYAGSVLFMEAAGPRLPRSRTHSRVRKGLRQ
jgi:CHASE2 domain-containing sensor protein